MVQNQGVFRISSSIFCLQNLVSKLFGPKNNHHFHPRHENIVTEYLFSGTQNEGPVASIKSRIMSV